jgi:Iron-containing redox enzyme
MRRLRVTVNHVPPAYEARPLGGAELREAVLAYAGNPIFLDGKEWENDDNPYRRQLRPDTLHCLDFDRSLQRDQALHYESLAAHRMLTSIYEAGLVFLPQSSLTADKYEDFRSFYSADNRARGEAIRPALENFAFGFLEDEVIISGAWNAASLEAFLREPANRDGEAMAATAEAIRASSDPQRAARMWLIQQVPDLLSGTSGILRGALGNFGEVQSEWFRISVDKCGYDRHATKHGTLFERTLSSAGLQADLHRYWQYYLPGSLLMNNYFHHLGTNHEMVFRCLGALFYTETVLADASSRAATLLTEVFDGAVDVEHFTGRARIGTGRARTVLEKLILPLVQRCGPAAIPEILRGFQECQVIAELAEQDFVAQLGWMDEGPANRQLHLPVHQAVLDGRIDAPVVRIVEEYGELSNTHSHRGDELCHIVSGTMRLVSGFQSYEVLEAGAGMVIWRNRLHGAIIESDECVYEIHSVGDYRACL